jgi:hypothetical protein
MSYTFTITGHPNIRATHVKTLEFTKDYDLSERGDCIVGINANFVLQELKKFKKKARVTISVKLDSGEMISDEFKFSVNQNFNSNYELVLRKSIFNSNRTFGFFLNKGANRLDRRIVDQLKLSKNAEVTIHQGWNLEED